MVSKSYCLTPLSDLAAPAAPRDVEDSVPRSSTSEAAPDELCDVEDSVPISSTSEAAPDELCDVEGSDPYSPLVKQLLLAQFHTLSR